MKKWQLLSGASILVLVVAGGYAANLFPGELAAVADPGRADFSDELIELGENLSKLGDCSACHTPVGSRAMSGGIGLPTPFGTIYSTNITPDVETGIGSWSYLAFERAMREGIDREGNHLYPAFPYDHFAAITDDDMTALYQFLMSQEPVMSAAVENDLPFPF
jgi:mono/diheme cytochrome c family protein